MPRVRRPAFLLTLALLGCEHPDTRELVEPETTTTTPEAKTSDRCGPQPDGSRRFEVLHINDVYRIEGVADGRGGLARIRTLRRELEAECSAVLVTHAGDTLFPSLLSNEFEGAQMIEILNALDGAQAFDPRLLVTFGNHEFDKGKLADAALLDARVDESQFNWIGTTLTFKTGDEGQPLVSGDNIVREQLLELGGVEVGVFSLLIDSVAPAYLEPLPRDHVAQAREAVQRLRAQGAELVIALTHLDADVDESILAQLPGASGPDVILGGHDHVLTTRTAQGRHVLKGDADALRVRVVSISIDARGEVIVAAAPEGSAIGPDTPVPDPDVQRLVDARRLAFSTSFCAKSGEPPSCLTTPLTITHTELLAEELEIRRYETNYGDWILDRALQAFAADKPDLALLNAGTLRLNQNIAPGTALTREIVEETFAYPAPLYLIEIDGKTLQAVLEQAVTTWTGSGHWLQVAGIAFRHDVEAGKVSNAVLVRPDGSTAAIEPKRKYRVVAPQFMLDATMGNQDGYAMLSMQQVVKKAAGNGTDLKQIVMRELEAAGQAGIAPQLAGRICSSDRPSAPCLAPD